jgi:predicted AlkP superfamily phosphohydrolase/phosphomutase
MGESPKVCIIGVDGATFSLVQPWVEEGKLPAFRRLMEEGAWGGLRSTIPAQTPPAWTSSVTGQNPGKHNIFNFFKSDGTDYRRRLTSHSDRRTKALWNMLGEEGKEVAVVHVPFTYPPEPVRGVMISGMPMASVSGDYTYPPDLVDWIRERVPEYSPESNLSRREEEVLLEEILKNTENEIRVVTRLMEERAWDFFMAVFVGLDVLQHLFWRFMDTTHPYYDPARAETLGPGILRGYQRIDRFIGEVLDRWTSEATILVYSDHGFGPLHHDFYITNWLIDEGFLVLKESPWLDRGRLLQPGWRDLGAFLCGSERTGGGRLLPTTALRKLSRLFFPSFHRLVPFVDWTKTRAYFPILGEHSLHINLRGREPQGIVEPGRPCEELKGILVEKLQRWIDEGVIRSVHRGEEIYRGGAMKNAPDLVIEMKDGYRVAEGIGPGLLSPSREGLTLVSGSHRSAGIFLIHGQGVRRGGQIESASIMDVAPTVLSLYGLAVPRDMDGKVLSGAFEEDFLACHPVRFDDRDMAREAGYFDYDEEGKSEIMKRLQALGYIDG